MRDRIWKVLAWIDWQVQTRIEHTAALIQNLTGADCFTQRNWMQVLAGLCYIAEAIGYPIGHGWVRIASLSAALLEVIFGLAIMANVWIGDPFDEIYRSVPFLNHRKVSRSYALLRLFTSAIAVGLFFDDAVIHSITPANFGFAAIAAAYWLESCNPLPPCSGKIGRWVRSLRPLTPVEVKS